MGDIFKAIPHVEDSRLLVGYNTADDSAIFQLDEQTGLVQSLDFFTPVVDDPYDYGAISAANSLSDIYAMGGRPLTALSMVCFPYTKLPPEVLTEIVRGGAEKVIEAGALVVGGHSVSDEEVKFGYSVTGLVSPNAYWRNDTPEAGDVLVLTKPLGTGLLSTAVKQDKLGEDSLKKPIEEMKRLNKVAAELASKYAIHAATDITGFGLMGHLFEMVKGKTLGAVIQCEDLPVFVGVFEAIRTEAFTRAHRTNRDYVADYDIPDTAAMERFGQILYDPQTSGGLLMALPQADGNALVAELRAAGHEAAVIGGITDSGRIEAL